MAIKMAIAIIITFLKSNSLMSNIKFSLEASLDI